MATTYVQLGDVGTGVANGAIGANKAVKWYTTAGKICLCTTNDQPIGFTMDAIADGAVGFFYRAGKGHEVYATGAAVVAGDYIACTTSGNVVSESPATTVTVYTIGQAKTASDSDGKFILSNTR